MATDDSKKKAAAKKAAAKKAAAKKAAVKKAAVKKAAVKKAPAKKAPAKKAPAKKAPAKKTATGTSLRSVPSDWVQLLVAQSGGALVAAPFGSTPTSPLATVLGGPEGTKGGMLRLELILSTQSAARATQIAAVEQLLVVFLATTPQDLDSWLAHCKSCPPK